MKKKISTQIAVALLGLAALQTSLAQGSGAAAPADHSGHAGHGAAKPAAAAADAAWVEAEVRRIDLANKKITLKHGEIKNIEMPPMTMVFVLKDGAAPAATLSTLKVGDKVRFQAAIEGGRTLVTALQR